MEKSPDRVRAFRNLLQNFDLDIAVALGLGGNGQNITLIIKYHRITGLHLISNWSIVKKKQEVLCMKKAL
jgi:hypothetical protein